MYMKKFLLALAVVLIGSVTMTYAQAGDKTAAAKRMTDSMTVKLQLTPEQVPQVQTINEAWAGKAAAIRGEGGERMEKMKKLKEANQERDHALKGVLTEAQFKDYQANKKEMKQGAKGRMRDRKRN